MNSFHNLFKIRKFTTTTFLLSLFICWPSLRAESINTNPQNPTDEATKQSYSRFLEVAPGIIEPSGPTLAIPKTPTEREAFRNFLNKFVSTNTLPSTQGFELNIQANVKVKSAPSREAQMGRMLENQETRTAQPDAMKFLAQTPLLAEVSDGEDKDLAQVVFWNEVALNVTSLDHTPFPANIPNNNFPFEQVGPAKTSRALAIVHIAMFEAINATKRKYESYKIDGNSTIQRKIFEISGLPPDEAGEAVSTTTAIAYAAYHTLLSEYPKKAAYLIPILAVDLLRIGDGDNKKNAGELIGEAAAQAILDNRIWDGSEYSAVEPPASYFSSANPARWKQDPLNADPNIALGGFWSLVRPFVGTSDDLFNFRPPPPPKLDFLDAAFKASFQEVHDLGGDTNGGNINPPGNSNRHITPSQRTSEQTFIAKFWAYDATALLCAPPRLYNMIATSLALKEKKDFFTNGLDFSRYLALVNIALADAGIGAWEAKFHYRYPRPVTAIRDLATNGVDKYWTPLGAPVSNAKADKVNFTPPFPSYPSGHAVFGAAMFEVLRQYFGTDNQSFEFVSDEYNGKNRDPGAFQPRPKMPRNFTSFSQAEKENGFSRILLGIHWGFDANQGYIQGHNIGSNVINKVYKSVN